MSDNQKMIKIFQRMGKIDAGDEIAGNEDIWFELSSEYIDFRNKFLTKRQFTYDELWIVHEYYGGEGNFYYVTKHHSYKNAFRIANDLIDSNYNISKPDLENYIDTVAVLDIYLLKEYKFLNDTWKDTSSDLHNELYQPDLDDRIKQYMKTS